MKTRSVCEGSSQSRRRIPAFRTTMPYDDPIAFLLTWTTYGTWLPGDARGWVEFKRGFQLPDPIRELESAARMAEDACVLTPGQRQRVELQIAEPCEYKGWLLHAANCRSNHVHVVFVVTGRSEDDARATQSLVYAPLE